MNNRPVSQNRPPGPKPRFPGEFLLASRDMLGLMERMARYGDGACIQASFGPIFLFNHPDAVREILQTKPECFVKSRALEFAKMLLGEGLLTSEDPFHRRQRALMQPAFHHKRVKSYAASMTHYAAQMRDEWKNGQVVDMHHEMMALTLSIVGKTLFNSDVGEEAHVVERAMNAVMPLFNRAFLPWGALLNRLPLPATRRFHRAKADLDATIARIIAEHKTSGDVGDLVSMLLLARDEDGAPMSDAQVRDEALTIFLAGHETTANALTYTWHLLAQNPEAEAKLHSEIDAVLADRDATLEDVENLPYTQMVFAEAMRLYPPAWALGRRAIQDCEIFGYPIPKGAIVLVSQWTLHRDARFWSEPLQFNPERFTEENKASRPKFAYFPFGSGPRTCIGESFAAMEGALLIATLAQKWRAISLTTQPLKLQPLITLRPRDAVMMRLERR
ncbi:MAG: cytochrome P450 [Armatimonadetes bacterium]|nr:cytochrome P450 [Armatimonadota bacterium]